ncbi:MAG: hypothetical protein P1V35_03315 [Planctomycetota bacterium]|nr:hypothetical protein [Planctomycetota bacterium]
MDWDSIYRIVEQAQELEGTAREAHVYKACGANHSLREQILKILGANVERAFLEPPPTWGKACSAETCRASAWDALNWKGRWPGEAWA